MTGIHAFLIVLVSRNILERSRSTPRIWELVDDERRGGVTIYGHQTFSGPELSNCLDDDISKSSISRGIVDRAPFGRRVWIQRLS